MEYVLGLLFVGGLAFVAYKNSTSPAAVAQRDAKAEREKKIVCAHCQTAGGVTTNMYKKKGGISGGKATGAILTAGVSLLATGLARKGWVTQLSCSNCGMTWEVAA